ncbi:MAG: TonB-dependent receptor [Bacteroidales bacterium]
MLKKITLLLMVVAITSLCAKAAVVRGLVYDKSSNEPLMGATVVIANTTTGTITDFDGFFQINVPNGTSELNVSYVSYQVANVSVDVKGDQASIGGVDITEDNYIKVEMQLDGLQMDEVVVTARKNMENTGVLMEQRAVSTIAIENIGSKEMSIKGLSDVQDGVVKMTGVSVADAGQIIVRGLGDRYSITTLNGQPIASPNPDNKLIPLDVFPTAAVKNVTVTKVYDVTNYADYSGAHIDISTKEQGAANFLSASFGLSGQSAAIGQDFYKMDNVSLFSESKAEQAISLDKSDARDYIVNNANAFDTDFDTEICKGLPGFSGNLAGGYNFYFDNGQELNVMASAGVSNENTAELDSERKTYNTLGQIKEEYDYDEYTTSLKMAGLATASVTLREEDRISYTFFYARNASNKYQLRNGSDFDSNVILSSNSVTHIYELMTNQLMGVHKLGDKWSMNWKGAYTTTASKEPDRREVMFERIPSGDWQLFTSKNDVVNRNFAYLNENEWNGEISSRYTFNDDYKLDFGASYKDKARDYELTRFAYNVNGITSTMEYDDIFNTTPYINYDNISSGVIDITRYKQSKDSYDASQYIISGFVAMDMTFADNYLLNLGVRYENSYQNVNYGSNENNDLSGSDFFPAVNFKYTINKEQQIRFATSRTITRPSFIEMAPFLYQESFGANSVIGNADIRNAYNYNVDLRYENFFSGADMFSATVYYKELVDPIERVQEVTGSGVLQTFINAKNGTAAGLELEYRKTLAKVVSLSVNGSYMYTDVTLSDGGTYAYTNDERQLQGASPYLFNADITYSPKFGKESGLNLALLYNIQGPRITAVGVNQLGDTYQQTFHSLNFAASYNINKMVTVSLKADNLLNQAEVYEQDIPTADTKEVVEKHYPGMKFSLGVSLKL